MTYTSDEIVVLWYMLGVHPSRQWKPYRDWCCSASGDVVLPAMERKGLVRFTGKSMAGGCSLWVTTEIGKSLARQKWLELSTEIGSDSEK